MRKMKQWMVLAITACTLNASASVIINGGFEEAFNENPPNGWNTATAEWVWRPSTDLAGNPNGAYSSTAAAEGNYYIRRLLYDGDTVGDKSFQSDAYAISGLPGGTTQLKLDLYSYAKLQNGNLNTYGRIDFYVSTDGSGSVLSSLSTSSILSDSDQDWEALAVTGDIPVLAGSFRVLGVVNITTQLTGSAYTAFDGFGVTAIPEPATIGLFAISSIGIILSRRLRM